MAGGTARQWRFPEVRADGGEVHDVVFLPFACVAASCRRGWMSGKVEEATVEWKCGVVWWVGAGEVRFPRAVKKGRPGPPCRLPRAMIWRVGDASRRAGARNPLKCHVAPARHVSAGRAGRAGIHPCRLLVKGGRDPWMCAAGPLPCRSRHPLEPPESRLATRTGTQSAHPSPQRTINGLQSIQTCLSVLDNAPRARSLVNRLLRRPQEHFIVFD